MAKPRVWLITGAASGIGREVTEVVLANGDTVVAAVRSPSALADLVSRTPTDRLLVLKCDVTVEADVTATFTSIMERFGRCDVVFNNAGIFCIAEVESKDQDAEARRMFEVNFWGAANVIREAVRVMRDLNPPGEGGLILNSGSMAGLIGIAGGGYYSASKHALEGLAESIAKEVDPKWNIKVSTIEFGSFKTRMTAGGGSIIYPAHPAYGEHLPSQIGRQAFLKGLVPFSDPGKAAKQVYEISKLASPTVHIPLTKETNQVVGVKIQALEDGLRQAEGMSEDLDPDESA